jgi:hypothetical protein
MSLVQGTRDRHFDIVLYKAHPLRRLVLSLDAQSRRILCCLVYWLSWWVMALNSKHSSYRMVLYTRKILEFRYLRHALETERAFRSPECTKFWWHLTTRPVAQTHSRHQAATRLFLSRSKSGCTRLDNWYFIPFIVSVVSFITNRLIHILSWMHCGAGRVQGKLPARKVILKVAICAWITTFASVRHVSL